jgi:hypothetical protein
VEDMCYERRRAEAVVENVRHPRNPWDREEPGTLTQGAPVFNFFPGSSRVGIEPTLDPTVQAGQEEVDEELCTRRASVVGLVNQANQHRRTRLMIRSQVQALMIQSQVQETCTLVRFTRLVP